MADISEPYSNIYETDARRPRLLIVDDQPIMIRMLHQIFAAEHEVFMATSGENALAQCRSNRPDLILLDVEMPGMSGLEVCRQIQADPELRDLPVIFVTAHSDGEAEALCWDSGGVDFICKPVSPRTAMARVKAHLRLKFQADLLRRMAFLDGLTGVANRRYFDEKLAEELKRSRRFARPLALLLIDIDFFKRYNDALGHQAGDSCLQQVAACIKKQMNRPADLAARYGGEEFSCILPETDEVGSLAVAKTLEAAVRDLQIPHPTSDVAEVVTVSIGVASTRITGAQTAEELIAKTDECLYEAKRAGRGRAYSRDAG